MPVSAERQLPLYDFAPITNNYPAAENSFPLSENNYSSTDSFPPTQTARPTFNDYPPALYELPPLTRRESLHSVSTYGERPLSSSTAVTSPTFHYGGVRDPTLSVGWTANQDDSVATNGPFGVSDTTPHGQRLDFGRLLMQREDGESTLSVTAVC